MKRTVTLLILDGWGIGRKDQTNPVYTVKPQTIEYIKSHFPSGALQASGIAVGLPWGLEGNSEVGHLTIGAGRVIYQHYPRITMAIRDGSFFANPALKQAFEHAKANNSAVNLVGLLSTGDVHSAVDHLAALLEFSKKEGVSKINLHLFADGKDSPPKSFLNILSKLPADQIKNVASVIGRNFAMDRDEHWERTEKAYQTLLGQGALSPDLKLAVEEQYNKKGIDEFLNPILVGPEARGIKENDAVIFFNYREDSMRQIVEAFHSENFDKFKTATPKNLYLTTMTRYRDDFNLPVAFPPEEIKNPLGQVISDQGKTQLRIAETEKYAHVTYFFNSYEENPFKGEYRVLIPSKSAAHHDQFPEMMASEISERVSRSIADNAFDFILVNLANPDMIAHTGNMEAAEKAIAVVDEAIYKIMKATIDTSSILIISSDHGNVERMLNPMTFMPETKHDPNPVPIYLIAKEYYREKTPDQIENGERESIGVLSDIAPTVLELMGIAQPEEMTGQSLLKTLQQNII